MRTESSVRMGSSIHRFVIFLGFIGLCRASLEAVANKEELFKLTAQEQHVVVLFGGEGEEKLETELAAIREDLVDSINAWVVKSEDESVKKELDPYSEGKALIVFYRNSIPVIYKGFPNEEEILETLIQYKDRCVKDLTDSSFEHQTQAASGATTGDWFVLFYKDECSECKSLMARIETLGCLHRGRINVASLNRGTTGAVTGRRFNVNAVPSMIFFRLGRMYRYEMNKFDVESLSSFITGFYKNVKGESIPLPKTPFDDTVQFCADYIRDSPFLCLALLAIPIAVILSFYYLTKADEPKPKKKKKKKDT